MSVKTKIVTRTVNFNMTSLPLLLGPDSTGSDCSQMALVLTLIRMISDAIELKYSRLPFIRTGAKGEVAPFQHETAVPQL